MVTIDEQRIDAFAKLFQETLELEAFDFCTPNEACAPGRGMLFPPRHASGVLDYFFFCTAHQFGFWTLNHDRYDHPMTGVLDGKTCKGSDFLSRCATRAWHRDPNFFAPARLTTHTESDWAALFTDDEGRQPLPMWPEHLAIIEAYTRWWSEQNTSPQAYLHTANASPQPVARFLALAGQVPGYREDPLQKKLQLLAVILANRPEHFLQARDPESFRSIIDYHLQRSALRTGLVRVTDPALEARLAARQLVDKEQEQAVRRTTYRAIETLVERSGVSVAAVDYFFFGNRRRCPEMSEPRCTSCPVESICAQRRDLFQPIFRTVDY